MDWVRTGVRSLGCQLILMTSSITNSLVTLTIDDITLFLQLLDVQNIRKICVSIQTRVMGNSNSIFKMAESI